LRCGLGYPQHPDVLCDPARAFAVRALAEEIKSDATQQEEIADGASDLCDRYPSPKAHVEDPMGLVFNTPVLTDSSVKPRRVRFHIGIVVSDFGFRLKLDGYAAPTAHGIRWPRVPSNAGEMRVVDQGTATASWQL